MTDKLPKRPSQHDLATISERYFQSLLPENWVVEIPKHDYGIDMMINIFEEGKATRHKLAVQLKASQESTIGNAERLSMRIATYNYLMEQLDVAIVVKYVADVNAAYWIFLRDVPAPNSENNSFTIDIPKNNLLSQVDWNVRAPVKVTTSGRFNLTMLGRFKLTTSGQSKLTTI